MDFKRLRAKHNLPRALLTETDIGAGRQSAGQPTPARRNVRGNATSLPELPAYQHALLAPVPLPRRPQPCLALAALKMHRDVLPPSIRWHSSTCQVLRCTCQFAPWNRCARALAPGRCHRKSIPNNKQVIRNPSQYYMLIRMAVEDLVPPSLKRNTFIPSCCKILHGLAVAPTSPPAPSAPLQRHPESPLATFPSPTAGGRTLVLFWNVLNGTLSAQ